MALRRIAVISDTHGMLRPEAAEVLQSAEMILHGGDFADRKTLDRLREFARVTAVRGNCDKDWAKELPREVCFELYGKKIYMVHNRKHMSADVKKADIVIYGHSHKYEENEADGKLWLNPGSGGPKRFGRPATMAVLEIDEESGTLTVKKIVLSGEDAQDAAADVRCPELASGELREIAGTIVKDLERGKSVDHIVKTRKISRAMTEQVCQIYFTHPGIDVQGVIDRIELRSIFIQTGNETG